MAKGESKITPAEMIGPWRREDYESFIALDCDLSPPKRNKTIAEIFGESGNSFHQRVLQDQQQLIQEAWEVRRAHPIYQWLSKDPNFKAAWRLFELKRRKAAADSDLALPTAPFVFLHEFVHFAGTAYQAPYGRSGSPRGGYSSHRKTAIKHADALHALVSKGISLDDYSDTQRLRELLEKLSVELRSTKRKRYTGKRSIERSVLKGFAMIMLTCCDLKSPAVVTHFASMVGLTCDEKRAQRYCNEAAA